MIDQPVLTIAIPTYNRAKYLDLCLERIGDEIDNLIEEERCLVNVFVADNGSADDTSKIVSKHQERLGNKFKAMRNSENMGMDYNFTQCYELAKTPYVWLVGDDDIVLPGGLKKVLDTLIESEIDLLYVNNYWFQDSYVEKPRKREGHGTSVYRNSLEFTRLTNVMLTYLSGLIVRTGIGSSYRNIMTASNLVQLSWVFPLLRDGQCFAIIEDWVVAAKGSNSGGYELVDVFGKNLKNIMGTILKGEPEVARAIQNGTIVNFFPGFVLEFRNGSSDFTDKNMKIGLKEAFSDNWRYYIFLMPLISMPLYFSRLYYYLIRIVIRLFGGHLI